MSTSAQPETTIRRGVEADVDQCFDVFFEAITHYLAKVRGILSSEKLYSECKMAKTRFVRSTRPISSTPTAREFIRM